MKILFKLTIENVKFIYDNLGTMSDAASYENKVEVASSLLRKIIERNNIKEEDIGEFLKNIEEKIRKIILKEKKEQEKEEKEEYNRKIKEELLPVIDNFFAGFLDKNTLQKHEELKEKFKFYLGINNNDVYFIPRAIICFLREIILQKHIKETQQVSNIKFIHENTIQEFGIIEKNKKNIYNIKSEYINTLSEFKTTEKDEIICHLRDDVPMMETHFKNIDMLYVDVLEKILKNEEVEFKILEIIKRVVEDIEL